MEIQLLPFIFFGEYPERWPICFQEKAGDELLDRQSYAPLAPQKLFLSTQPVPSVSYQCQDLLPKVSNLIVTRLDTSIVTPFPTKMTTSILISFAFCTANSNFTECCAPAQASSKRLVA